MRHQLGRVFRRRPGVPIPRQVWPDGQRAALSFSFDDARPSQVIAGIPVLERLGVPATFFVLPDKVAEERVRWRDAVAAGHEIGNHTLHHPCRANFPWSREHALEDLTLSDLRTEIDDASRQIRKLLEVEPVSFAYPCGQTFVGRGRNTASVVPLIAERFIAGRTFNDISANAPLHCDLARVAAISSDDLTFAQLEHRLDATLDDGAWLVLGGHEFGDHLDRETTAAATVEAVVRWCREHDVWIDTIGSVAEHVAQLTRAGEAA